MTSVDDPLLRRSGTSRAHAAANGRAPLRSKGSASRAGQKWSRLVHVYASMIAFAVVLLFSFTGLMLNHPTWTLGDQANTSVSIGELPVDLFLADGSLDYLTLSEFARSELGARGEVTSFGEAGGDASIIYADPGYTADLVVDVEAATYEFTAEQQGWVAVLSDFHTGTDTGGAWSWAIDASAIFLIVVSLSGLVLQFFLRKRRRSA
ncbi:MAG: PepSY-associated TM helix domain-containing protein, partial [Ilumatobacter sp.]